MYELHSQIFSTLFSRHTRRKEQQIWVCKKVAVPHDRLCYHNIVPPLLSFISNISRVVNCNDYTSDTHYASTWFMWKNVAYLQLFRSFWQTLRANIKLATEAEGLPWISIPPFVSSNHASTEYTPNRSFNHSRQMSHKISPTTFHYSAIKLPFDGLEFDPLQTR